MYLCVTVDIYSIPISLFLIGQAPYASRTVGEVIAKIMQQKEIRIPTDLRLSDECVDCLLRLLQREPSRRIPLSELLVHPFVAPHSPSSNGTALLPDTRDPRPSTPRRTSLLNVQPNATTTRLGERPSQPAQLPGPNCAPLPPPAILNPSDPPAEMLHAAKALCKQAAEYRQQNKHTEAYSIYLRASEMLIPVFRMLPDSTLKTEVKQQISICLDAAECLKKLVRISSASASSETPEDGGGGQDSAHSRSRPPDRPPPPSENSLQKSKAKQSESAAATRTGESANGPNGATEGASHAGSTSDPQRPLTPQRYHTPPPLLTVPDSEPEVDEQATEANEEHYFDANSGNAPLNAPISDHSLSSVCYGRNTSTNACHLLPTCSPSHSDMLVSLASTCANTVGNPVQAPSPASAEAAQSAIVPHILRHDPQSADEATAALMAMSNADQILALDDGNCGNCSTTAEVEHVKLALGNYEQALQVLLDRVGALTGAEQQLLLPELNK